MKKNKTILIIIILCVLIVICLCVKELNNYKDYVSTGINVSGPKACYEFNPSNGKQVLYIKSDGAVITGDAQADTYILIAEDVSSVEIKDLNQGKYKICVRSENNMTPPSDLEVIYSGTNSICLVEWFEKLYINGKDAKANLLISSGIHLTKELALSDGKIQAGYIIVPEKIVVTGNIRLYLKTVEHQLLNDSLWAARIVSNKLLIDLNEGGTVNIKDCSEYYTIYVTELKLGQNTKLMYPVNGIIANYNYGNGIYPSDGTIFNADKSDAEEVIFEYYPSNLN